MSISWSKIVELNQVIKKYEKCQISLGDVLSRQRYSNDKCGLDFSNFLINQTQVKPYL